MSLFTPYLFSLHQRGHRFFFRWSAVFLLLILSACDQLSSLHGSSSTPQAVRLAFVYSGNPSQDVFLLSHYQAQKAIEQEWGAKIKITEVQHVIDNTEAEKIFHRLAEQGHQWVMGTSFTYTEALLKTAHEFPRIQFEQALGEKTHSNLSVYQARSYMGAYMAGMVAAGMTRSHILGIVASLPVPEVIRDINAFALGAQSINPKVKIRVLWVGEWFNPPKETEAAQALIKNGADVLMQTTHSLAVIETAKKNKKRALGWYVDMSAYAEQAHLASVQINWQPYYAQSIAQVMQGKPPRGQKTGWGVQEGVVDLVALSADIPAHLQAKIEGVRQGLKDGSFDIWKGPIVDQQGQFIINKDETASDEVLNQMSVYVKGIEGKIPSR